MGAAQLFNVTHLLDYWYGVTWNLSRRYMARWKEFPEEEFRNPTVVVVVDRTELEGQLAGWVERLLGEIQQQDIAVWRANSRAELREFLATDRRGLIISMIHKFEGVEKDANARGNIYVFIDEAHRSVAKDLGTYLMAALPNSTIIGFTGTPIARTPHGEGTFKIFGADDDQCYLDKYSIAESIEDETTLPIRHMMAPSEMAVPAGQLDREFFALAEMEGVADVEEPGPRSSRGPPHLPHRRRQGREGRGVRRSALPGERATPRIQGIPRLGQSRSLRQVQASARQAAAA